MTAIVAMTVGRRVIAKGDDMPWMIPEDMVFFRQQTVNKTVIVGRKTHELIGSLPKRTTLVVSRSGLSMEEAVKKAGGDFVVIGGAQIYELAFPFVNRIIVTEVLKEFEGDCVFPAIPSEFRGPFPFPGKEGTREHDGVAYRFMYYERNHPEVQYLQLVREALEAPGRSDRTGTGTTAVFGRTMRFDLRGNKIPVLTTKKVYWTAVVAELLWFISGSTDVRELQLKKVKIWDGNTSRRFLDQQGFTDREVGDAGPIYGFQWRHFGAEYETRDTDYQGKGVDQLHWLLKEIENNPTSRRLVLSAWNPEAIPKMVLPPCHVLAQFFVDGDELSCQMYQRSGDIGLGVPFNIASYALLTHLIAHVTGLKAREFIHVLGDAHVYTDHRDALTQQLGRVPREFPIIHLDEAPRNLFLIEQHHIDLRNYKPHPPIKMDMAV